MRFTKSHWRPKKTTCTEVVEDLFRWLVNNVKSGQKYEIRIEVEEETTVYTMHISKTK